ncbi:putative RNA recognition motif domain, nucleotide-binding alpha-beta plait domain superfamily [Helianthus annuus]|nr:putative RNA recognition motif domain, nucleotide-binding alpha-beta plait domain superfamily [Helianthus annuus]
MVVVEDVVMLEAMALAVANQKPTKTLFIINFDPVHTRVRDIENHFEPYGNVLHVHIRRNFAFVQFETQEATKALECTHMSKILDRVISVEYALRDDSESSGEASPPPPIFPKPGRGGRWKRIYLKIFYTKVLFIPLRIKKFEGSGAPSEVF